mgnify:FL=1
MKPGDLVGWSKTAVEWINGALEKERGDIAGVVVSFKPSNLHRHRKNGSHRRVVLTDGQEDFIVAEEFLEVISASR